MNPLRFLLTCVLSFFVLTQIAQESYVVRIPDLNEKTLEIIQSYQLEITNIEKGKYLEVLASEKQFQLLKKKNLQPVIVTTEQDLINNLQSGLRIEGYKTYDEIVAIMQDYADNYPDICVMHDIGNSLGKQYFESGLEAYEDYQHDIWALKISDNPETEEDEPSLLFNAAHHARETIGPAVVLNFMDHLIENYGTDQEVTDAIENNQIWIVPLVNPDGYKIVVDSLEVWWRKTIRDNNGNQQIDPFLPDWIEPDGVDANRNYGVYWGGDWTTAPPFRETYRGPSSFSEPCTQAIKNLMGAHHFVTELSYHSYGEHFFFPWEHNSIQYQTPDHLLYATLGNELAAMTPKLGSGNYYAGCVGKSSRLTGGSTDYAYGRHGIISYGVELAQDFIPPPEDIQPVCDANLNSQLYLFERLQKSILTGHVLDANSNEPITAKVFIEGIDNDPNGRFDYKSDSLYGRYYRLVNPGDYEVTFSAFGYQPQTVNMTASEEGKTNLEIHLQPDSKFSLAGLVTDESGNYLVGAQIVVVNSPVDTCYTDESGAFEIDNFYAGTYSVKVFADHFFTLDTLLEIDEQSNYFAFKLNSFDIIDFESGEDVKHFQMSGHQNWYRDDQHSFQGDYSMAAPVLNKTQYAMASIDLYFETDVFMTLATQVSNDSITQGTIFTMDEQLIKTYYGIEDWVQDTFFFPQGTHHFQWSLSRDYRTPAPFYENTCRVDMIEFHNITTIIRQADINNPELFSCYPNPSNSKFYIDQLQDFNRIYHAGIYDNTGKLLSLIESSNLTNGGLIWDGFTGSNVPAPKGIYFLKIVTDKGSCTKKLVKN